MIVCLAVIVLCNVYAWESKGFSDFYITYVFPIWVGTYGRFTGMFPFSVGEWLIVAGACLLLLAVILIPVRLVLSILGKRNPEAGKLYRWKRRIAGYHYGFAWLLVVVAMIMSLNCFMLYHGTTFQETYFPGEQDEYSLEELADAWNVVAVNCIRLSGMVERDERGRVVYPGSVNAAGESVDVADKAREVMAQMGEEYPRLKGYYPRAKAMFFSDLMCQMYMAGYYFPFSMEANYNDVMQVTNTPSTICHELAHLRGYILEDEANFISFLACTRSDDIFFQYSGYLEVMSYLYQELNNLTPEEEKYMNDAGIGICPITKQILGDATFVLPEQWDRIEEEAVLDTETVEKASDVFVETSLQLNGVSDGMKSYSRVVELLILYYRQHPEVPDFPD